MRESLREDDGIISACPIRDDPPVLMVLYNPLRLRFADVLAGIERRGVRARLIRCPDEKGGSGING